MGEPDIGFQAGFGFYLGLVATGVAAIAGLLAGATTATLLGILPSTVTFVAIVGHILAKRAHGLPERLGRSRRRRLASYAPAAGFAAVLLGLTSVPVPGLEGAVTSRLVVVTVVFVALTGVSAFGLNRLSRKRYVEAITDDEPAARWTWHRTGYQSGPVVATVLGAATTLGGLGMAWTGHWFGLFWTLYGLITLLAEWTDWGDDWNTIDPSERRNPPEIRAHDVGLVIGDRKLVPWEEIADVRLTDDALVVEREGFAFDIRCDRSVIDDPESVRDAIRRARERDDRSTASTVPAFEY